MFDGAGLGISAASRAPHLSKRTSGVALSGKAASPGVYLSRSTRSDLLRIIISGAAFACSSLREPEKGVSGRVT